MPYNKKALQQRVEKVRKEEPHRFDLEKDSFSSVIKKREKKEKKEKVKREKAEKNKK